MSTGWEIQPRHLYPWSQIPGVSPDVPKPAVWYLLSSQSWICPKVSVQCALATNHISSAWFGSTLMSSQSTELITLSQKISQEWVIFEVNHVKSISTQMLESYITSTIDNSNTDHQRAPSVTFLNFFLLSVSLQGKCWELNPSTFKLPVLGPWARSLTYIISTCSIHIDSCRGGEKM